MAFHNNPRIVTDGLVLCADANARSSYPDAPATRGGDINTGWQDYGSNQANYVVLGKDSIKLSNNDESLTLYNSTGFENWGLDTGPRCFTFDDTDDYGRTQDTLVPTANGTPLTLEAWAMTIDGGSGWQTVLGIHGTYTQIGFYNSSFRSGRNGGGGNSFLSSISISTNVWYHMSLTINSAKTGIAYLDGVQVATGSVGTGTGSNGRFNLASYNGTGSEVLDGKIGAVRAYNRILSSEEVLKNFKAQNSVYGK
mgnify:CR=1 FL=1